MNVALGKGESTHPHMNMKRESAQYSEKGFTLLEIIVVITLVVLILSFTTLFFGNVLPGARLNSAARELSAMMRYAKILAQNNGEPQTVLINLDTGRYGIEGVQTRNIPEGINIRVTDPVNGEVNRGSYPILFHESGIAEGGNITLWNTKRTLNIELDPIVGSVILK
jgi:general secretion pathway protein H